MSCSSVGSSLNANAAEITADTYITSSSFETYLFLTSDSVISEIYNFSDSGYTVGDTHVDIAQYTTGVSGYMGIIFTFDFSDSKYLLNQTYNVEFDINTSQTYIYTYYFPHYMPINFWADHFSVGDTYQPWRLNSAYIDVLDDEATNDLQTSKFDSVSHVSFPIYIPSDHKALGTLSGSVDDVFVQDRIVILSYITFFGTKNRPLPSTLEISNIKLVPTGATELLYADKVYQNEILGSDEEGSESGIKGIFKKISELPLQIWSLLYQLGDRIGGFFTELKDNLLQGIKDLFVPSEEDITNFKDDMDKLFSEHLGVVYEAPDLMVIFVKKLADFSPQRSDDMNDYYIEFPSKTIYLTSDLSNDFISDTSSNGGEAIPVVPDNTGQGTFRISFGLFNDKPYSTFYSIYNVFIIFFTILCFCNYAIQKYEKIMED